MPEIINKEVFFMNYCPYCVRADEEEDNDICHHCLSNPINQHSHKPVDFQKKER